MWWRLIPAPGALYFLIAGTYGVVYFLPFIAHRAIAPRLGGVAATLVFPLAWVAIEYLFQRWGTPYGSWFSLAYTQAGTLTLLQLASLTGTAGVSFLITWFAASLACALQTDASKGPAQLGVTRLGWTYGVVLLLVLGFGHLRLTVVRPETALVRTAGLVPDDRLMREHEETLMPARRGEPFTEAGMDSLRATAERLNADLFRRTHREAEGGAKLIAWSETAGRIFLADEPLFLDRAGDLAAEHGVFLMLGYGVLKPDAPKPFDNKVVAIDANGVVSWEFLKAVPIVGAESPFMEPGDGVVRCHDLDFPRLLRQAQASGIGLMVGPSADWPEITPLHANMAIMRAIENGFSLFRPTSTGRSVAVDARGREVATVDYADDAIIAYLSVRPSPTLYGKVGDLFSWICVLGFISLVLLGLKASRKSA
jgi:apolipoprotein N-acyltransferase